MKIICNLLQLTKLCSNLVDLLTPNSLILLDGNLGSGKTTLVQCLGKALGIVEPVTSPTFTLINEYYSGKLPLYHIDLYRLDQPHHIENLYLERYWQGQELAGGITAIEWAEKLPPTVLLPSEYWRIVFEILPDDRRQLTFSHMPSGIVLHWH
ncbi:MAG: tRNA (adenosine(37)-N6)-threonylcarbamoyltransferase complex ATPase subunit type 1 TsaE [Pseudanabaenaceae cyanobacterium]